jgi:glucan endo-1,3-alpha-glucosidase
MGTPWAGTIATQVSLAFQASNDVANEFKLFFSFDYEGGAGAWSSGDVSTALQVRFYYKFEKSSYPRSSRD